MNTTTQQVLFIDDDRATNYLNKKVASNLGFFSSITTVQSGFEGLDYLKSCENHPEKKPDLIFLDINMPGMNGWEFLDEFYKLSDTIIDSISVVILSTSTEPKDIEKFKSDKKLVDFMNKPINPSVLDSLVRKLDNA